MTYREILYSQGFFYVPEEIRHILDNLEELFPIEDEKLPNCRAMAKIIIREWLVDAGCVGLILPEEYTKISSWLAAMR